MPIFNNVQELLNDAMSKGIIQLGHLNVRIGPIDIVAPNVAINVIKPYEWKKFLTEIVEKSDMPAEVNQAKLFLSMFVQVEQTREQQLKDFRQNAIDEIDIHKFTSQLNSCNTADEIINLIDSNLISKGLPVTSIPNDSPNGLTNISNDHAKNVIRKQQQSQTNDGLRWKRPVNVNGKLRFYTHDLDWYIERQEVRGPNGGLINYYSIFSPDGREKARFDRLKDAKENMLKTFEQLG